MVEGPIVTAEAPSPDDAKIVATVVLLPVPFVIVWPTANVPVIDSSVIILATNFLMKIVVVGGV